MDVRDVSIISQVAAKAATELLVASIHEANHESIDDEGQLWSMYYDMVRERVLADVKQAEAERQFPGSQVEQAQTTFVPSQQFGPAPVPGAASTDIDLLWREYFRNPGDWWDNRQNKTNPNGPDFKKKVGKFASADDKRNAPALWIDRKDTPTWVMDQLGKF